MALKSESLKIKKKKNTEVAAHPLSYADYKANTPAWRMRNKTYKGKPVYSIPDSVWRKIAEES